MKASKFSSFSSGGSDDKKAFAACTRELHSRLQACAACAGDGAQPAALQQVSELVSAIGATPLPLAQPSWGKEVLAFFATVSEAKEAWLCVQDFASISRLLTRASAEKQLPPNAAEAEGLYNLLIAFVKHNGRFCRDGGAPIVPMELLGAPSGSAASGLLHSLNSNQGLLVMHEVIRGVAQLLWSAPERLRAHRFEALSALLPFCDRHAVDVETRYAAIDAVGNLMSHGAGDEALALLPGEAGLFSAGPAPSAREDAEAEKGRRLLALEESCLAALIDNLRNSVALLTAVAAPTEDGAEPIACPPGRLLVSCLRALAQAMLASHKQHRVLRHSFQPLLQTSYTVFAVIVPPIAARDAVDTRRRDEAAADRGAAEHSESKLLLHAYRFLGALASLDPRLFMRSWQLFLTDSIATDNALAALIRHASPPSALPVFRSPLLVGASRAAPAVRVAAVQCLRALLAGLPMRKWLRATFAARRPASGGGLLGDSVASTLVKLLRFAVLALALEAHDAVVQELLLLAQALVGEMPLVALGAAGGALPLEELALALFAAVMRIAACESAVQGRPEARLAASQSAIEWLNRQVSSRPQPLNSFAGALAQTFIASSSSFSDALRAAHGSADGASVSGLTWRGGRGATPAAQGTGASDFKCALGTLLLLSTEGAPGGAHGLACRSLCASLMASYGAHMLADGSWLHSLVDRLLRSPLPSLRLLGGRLVFCDLQRRVGGGGSRPAVLGCYGAEEATSALLLLLADADHQCRGQAVACLGSYPRWLWAQLEGGSSRERVLGALLDASADKIGNVRAAAFKAMGEAALRGGLALRPADSFVGEARLPQALSSSEAALVSAIVRQLRGGCADSKLAARVQAVWALGGLLLVLLPLRRQKAFSRSGSDGAPDCDCISDEAWLASGCCCMALLLDSDKLLPSAVRCLGFVAAGLSPQRAAHLAQLTSIVDTLVNKILFTDAAVSLTDWEYYGEERYQVQRQVETLPHKLVYSICQSLGFVGWVLAAGYEGCSADAAAGAQAMLERARNVLAVMLRHDAVKVRLQAAKALLALICRERRGTAAPAGAYSNSVVTALDGALKLVSGSRLAQGSAGGLSGTAGRVAVDSLQSALRSSALQRVLLLLLWVIVDPAACAGQSAGAAPPAPSDGDEDESVTMVSQSLVFHSDDLMDWLGASSLLGGKPLCLNELSLTPSELALTTPALALPAAASATDIARRVCGGVARVLVTHARASAGRDGDSGGWSASVHATAEAWERLQVVICDGPVDRRGSPLKAPSLADSAFDDDDEI